MNHKYDDGKKEGPGKLKQFPNYLMTKSDEEKPGHRAPRSSAFVADQSLDATSSVPFLERKKPDLRNHQSKKTDTKLEKDYFVMEKRRFKKEKRAAREQQRWQMDGSIYQSRRPFKPTEFPPLWYTRADKKPTKAVDYQQIRSSMVIPTDQLILIDFNPPAEESVSVETTAKKAAPKRALHRSLKGIMEQEKVQKDWDVNPKPAKNSHNFGYRSYFD